MSQISFLCIALLSLLLVACYPNKASSEKTANTPPTTAPNSSRIVLLGDEMRKNILPDCIAQNICPDGSEALFLLPPPQATVAQTADMAHQAALGVLVLDSATGPLPIIREHTLIARQAYLPLAVFLTQSEVLTNKDLKDLLELEITEMRDLLDSYDMDGKHARIYVGYQGLQQLLADAATLTPRQQPSTMLTVNSRRLHSYIYNLSREEGGHTMSAGDSMDIWIGGQTVHCKLVSPQTVAAGETPEVLLEAEKPLAVFEGQRFLLQQNGRPIAVGVVATAE
jgi:elongation factor Tu, chloroplastic